MVNIKRHLLYIFVIITISSSIAYSIFGNTYVLGIPYNLLKPQIDEKGISLDKNDDTIPWLVFSDNNSNVTYRSPGSNRIRKSLKFLEQFYVIDKKNGWLHIAKGDLTSNLELKKWKDYGWIYKDNLLLHSQCFYSKNKYAKAICINQSRYYDEINTFVCKDKIYLSKSTNLSSNQSIDKWFDIFYIFKMKDNIIFIGNRNLIETNNIQDTFGWIKKDDCIIWKNNIALEHNWYSDAVNERERWCKTAKLYTNINEVKRYNKRQLFTPRFFYWENDLYEDRVPGTYLRFPILSENIYNDVLQVAVFGFVSNENKYEDNIYNISIDNKNIFQKKIDNHNVLIKFFTSANIDGLSHSIYQRVALLNRRELGKLIDDIEFISYAFLSNNTSIRSIFRTLAENNGLELPSNFYEKSIPQLYESLYLIYDRNSALITGDNKNNSLDISFNKQIIYKYCSELSQKKKKLENIFYSQDNSIVYDLNGVDHFWIEESLFP